MDPKPIVQEGIILPDGSSARVSREEGDKINIGSGNPVGPIRILEAKPLGRGRYAILIPGFEDHQIVLKSSSFSRAKLFFDGEVVKKEKGSKDVAITSVEGLIAKIEMRPSMLDPLPQVWVDGEKLNIAPPIKWYQWVWISIPLIALIVLGTFVGAIFGIPAMLVNIQIFRSRLSVVMQYGLSLSAYPGSSHLIYDYCNLPFCHPVGFHLQLLMQSRYKDLKRIPPPARKGQHLHFSWNASLNPRPC